MMEVNLKKESWHFRLNRWSLRRDPKHWSLCPYFWLTVWNMITFLPRLPFRAVEGLGDRLFEGTRVAGTVNRTFDRIMMAKKPGWMQKLDSWFSRLDPQIFAKIWLGFIGSMVLLIFGRVIWTDGWISLLKIVLVVGGFLLGTGLIFLLAVLMESDVWQMAKGMWRSFMDKVCPAINWD